MSNSNLSCKHCGARLGTEHSSECPESLASFYKAKLATAEQERDELQRKYDSAEFWRDWVYPDGATAEQVQAELADYRAFMDNASEVYLHITNGRISKVNTLAEAVIGEADAVQADAIEEAVKEATEELERERDVARRERDMLVDLGIEPNCFDCERSEDCDAKIGPTEDCLAYVRALIAEAGEGASDDE